MTAMRNTPAWLAKSTPSTSREKVLAAAERCAVDAGCWSKVRVGDVATKAGFSRQTVYNEFGDKYGLTQALVVRLTQRVLDGIEPVVAKHESLGNGVEAGVRMALELAGTLPLVRVVLDRSSESDDLLSLVTTDAAAVYREIQRRVVRWADEFWPGQNPEHVRIAGDVLARTVVSHLVCPAESPDVVARGIGITIAALSAYDPGH